MNARLRLLVIALTAGPAVHLAGPRAAADIVFYTSEASFNAAASGLVTQTFASANIAPIGISVIANPLNNATNNAVFSAGSILPSLTLSSSASHAGQDLGVAAAGTFGNTNKGVYNNFGGDSLFLTFGPAATAVGFGLLNPASASVNVTVDGPGGAALASMVATVNSAGPAVFFGAIATNGDQIGRIELLGVNANANLRFAGVDRVVFHASVVPEPASIVLCGLGLASVVGLAARRRWARG
jgi:hypothetical protein